MIKPFDLLMGVLNDIEDGLKNNVSADSLAAKYSLSSSHLQRLFHFTFGQSIGTYIRLRKLSASIEDLLNTDLNVLSIALEYGLDYEQSYIRAFKREFGLTPGDLRKKGKIIKIKPPLQLFNSNKFNDGISFEPDIVMVPKFHTIGKKYKIELSEHLTLIPEIIKHFYNNDRKEITNKIENNEIICISTDIKNDDDHSCFMPSVLVKSLDEIPDGFEPFTFPSSLCLRFHFVGPEETQLNIIETKSNFLLIENYIKNINQNYIHKRKEITIDRIFPSAYAGKFKLWEWFTPVIKKT